MYQVSFTFFPSRRVSRDKNCVQKPCAMIFHCAQRTVMEKKNKQRQQQHTIWYNNNKMQAGTKRCRIFDQLYRKVFMTPMWPATTTTMMTQHQTTQQFDFAMLMPLLNKHTHPSCYPPFFFSSFFRCLNFDYSIIEVIGIKFSLLPFEEKKISNNFIFRSIEKYRIKDKCIVEHKKSDYLAVNGRGNKKKSQKYALIKTNW